MEFSYKIEPGGWALITHANGAQYRIRYNNEGEPLSAGELHLLTTDGNMPGVHPPTKQHVGLVRLTIITDSIDADDVRDTATRFLHANGYPCVGEDYANAVVILSEVRDNGDWVVTSVNGNYTEVITTAAHSHNS